MQESVSMNARKCVHAQKPYPSQAFAHESSKHNWEINVFSTPEATLTCQFRQDNLFNGVGEEVFVGVHGQLWEGEGRRGRGGGVHGQLGEPGQPLHLQPLTQWVPQHQLQPGGKKCNYFNKQPKTTISQDVQTRFPVQLAFAKFLSKIKRNF